MPGKGVECNFVDESLPTDSVDNSGRRRPAACWSRALFIGAYYYVAPGLPQAAELRDIKVQVPLQVYSRDGRLIAEFGEMKRTPVAYADIPPLLIKAVWRPRTSASSSIPASTIAASSAASLTSSARATRGRRQHDHAAGSAHARRDEASGTELRLRPVRREVQGVDPRVSHGAGVHEGRDPRALS